MSIFAPVSSRFVALLLGLTVAPCMAHAAAANTIDFVSSSAQTTYGGTYGPTKNPTQATAFTTTVSATSAPITSFSGSVNIGALSAPLATLQVGNGSPTNALYIDSNLGGHAAFATSQGAWIEWNANSTNGMTDFVNNAGGGLGGWQFINAIPNSKGVISYTPLVTIQGDGSITAIAYYHSSDARLKMDIHTVDNALDRLLAIKGVEFNWKKDGRADMGVVAQNVAEVFPNVVHKDDSGMMSVEYDSLVGPMIEGMRQLKTENDGLKAEIKEIRAEIKTLQQNNAATHAASTAIEKPAAATIVEH